MRCSLIIIIFSILLLFHKLASGCYTLQGKDIPCKAKQANDSFVCVCTAEHCDTITRESPLSGTYCAYTSSKAGSRFEKKSGSLEPYSELNSDCLLTLELDLNTQYQRVEGFGTGVTDSAGENLMSLKDPKLRQHLINSYFSKTGIELNMMRVPIGGTDFSSRGYSYNDLPKNDKTLSNFTLAYEDMEYKIPIIKASFEVSLAPVHIVSSTWNPPAWMKSHHTLTGHGRLQKKYFQAYAEYHYRFLEEYDKQNITIWGITTTNEPLNGLMTLGKLNRLDWVVGEMGDWIENNLGPLIRNSTKFNKLKIIGVDDQRFTIPIWFNVLILQKPGALKYIDGVGVHFYFDKITPPSMLTMTMAKYPDKFVISTEACEGANAADNEKVVLGSWTRCENYAKDIMEDLNYNVVGWIDWNMCLNEEGGPTWVKNYVDSPIIVSADKQEFYKQPMFYAMGHFSKFIPRESRRVKVTEKHNNDEKVENVAFITPHETAVVVLFNEHQSRTISIKVGDQHALVSLEAKSITTVELALNSTDI